LPDDASPRKHSCAVKPARLLELSQELRQVWCVLFLNQPPKRGTLPEQLSRRGHRGRRAFDLLACENGGLPGAGQRLFVGKALE
jgi:hypothetical protein